MKVIKRDGTEVFFNQNKITTAIFKAAQAMGGNDSERAEFLSEQVVKKINKDPITVEEIQDLVEEVLIENGHAKTAKAYILYRNQRSEIRNFQNLMLNSEKMISEYLGETDWKVRENSNMNFSLQGLNNHIISKTSSIYWLEKIYPLEIKNAHNNGDFHIHDLSLLAPYCAGWDLEDLLLKGFRGAPQKIASAPPKHFKSALGQIANFFYTLQGENAGAQALSSFDTYLAPFVKYDNLNYKQVLQSMQEFIFNINVPTRVGFQTPFINLTFDVVVPSTLKGLQVIIGGERKEEIYDEFQEEMDMINRAFCEVMLSGDAESRLFTFPIPTYNVTEDFFDVPVIDDIMEMTAKYGIPYFANFINSDLSPNDARSMCCRLRLDNRELIKRGGGLFGSNPLTGSIGVVTLNMPRIGYKSKTLWEYLSRVTHLVHLAKDSLLIKRNIIEQMTNIGLYPYSKYYLNIVHERFGQYWSNHFNTIGLVGLNESLLNFIGEDIGTKRGQKYALIILDHMRDLLRNIQEETGQLFNLEATPAESTAYRLARLDKELYPDIITAGQDESYYTNSSQLPVNYTDDFFEVLELQDKLQTKYTGGTVLHMFLGERLDNSKITAQIIKRIFENCELPYISLTPTFSICPEHGYLFGEQFTCPHCGVDTEVWSRIVGYYRPIQNWNKGKQEEYKERINFKETQSLCENEEKICV